MPDTQYFTNIDGKYVKDAEARQQLNDLKDYVESLDQPWQPLEDGYSNFWFELTDDTLSPWLNFSAKNADAVIDWGDGSGEQTLTTLTPTHTYAKAGKYVVKVKGVTGIAKQNTSGYTNDFLKYAELNDDVTALAQQAFEGSIGLKQIVIPTLSSVGVACLRYCVNLEKVYGYKNIASATSGTALCLSLKNVIIESGATTIGEQLFNQNLCLLTVTLPSTVTSIDKLAFKDCQSLEEVHISATAPPTLGENIFQRAKSSYVVYVPVGYGNTYKNDTYWSTYADHILEEGQTPNRMMLAKFGSAGLGEEDEKMR